MPRETNVAATAPPRDEREALLCESCGYPLDGLAPAGDCPECGDPVAASDPRRRTGPLWARRPGPGAWVDVVVDLIARPTRFFRKMRVDGSNVLPRLYLLTVACVGGGGWSVAELAWNGRSALWAWVGGMLAAKSVLLLSYTEAGGVAFFSRQRGWRVPFSVAERVVCYASPGWLPAAAALIVVHHYASGPWLVGWLEPLTGSRTLARQLIPAAYILIGGLAILGFESLVYIGVRQVRFANRPAHRPRFAAMHPPTGDPGSPPRRPSAANPDPSVP